MGGFLGSYLHQLDGKGRVSLPASFRRGHEKDRFVLVHVHEEALSLYPEESWQGVQESLRDMARRRPEYRHQVLGITADARELSLDKQGRLLIPDRFRDAVGLDSEALIVGAIDRIEIWEPERFRESTGESDEEFQRFVKTIFA